MTIRMKIFLILIFVCYSSAHKSKNSKHIGRGIVWGEVVGGYDFIHHSSSIDPVGDGVSRIFNQISHGSNPVFSQGPTGTRPLGGFPSVLPVKRNLIPHTPEHGGETMPVQIIPESSGGLPNQINPSVRMELLPSAVLHANNRGIIPNIPFHIPSGIAKALKGRLFNIGIQPFPGFQPRGQMPVNGAILPESTGIVPENTFTNDGSLLPTGQQPINGGIAADNTGVLLPQDTRPDDSSLLPSGHLPLTSGMVPGADVGSVPQRFHLSKANLIHHGEQYEQYIYSDMIQPRVNNGIIPQSNIPIIQPRVNNGIISQSNIPIIQPRVNNGIIPQSNIPINDGGILPNNQLPVNGGMIPRWSGLNLSVLHPLRGLGGITKKKRKGGY